jgi:regulator of nucleoside diphosphate kinase
MSGLPKCYLTTKEYSILEEMRERGAMRRDDTFRHLLWRKIASATIVFPEDIGDQVATIGRQVQFKVNSGPTECYQLVQRIGDLAGDDQLPVTTRWGLALLGLTVGDTILVENTVGNIDRLRLEHVAREGGSLKQRDVPSPAEAEAANKNTMSNVVSLGWREVKPTSKMVEDPDNDPGPNAA